MGQNTGPALFSKKAFVVCFVFGKLCWNLRAQQSKIHICTALYSTVSSLGCLQGGRQDWSSECSIWKGWANKHSCCFRFRMHHDHPILVLIGIQWSSDSVTACAVHVQTCRRARPSWRFFPSRKLEVDHWPKNVRNEAHTPACVWQLATYIYIESLPRSL